MLEIELVEDPNDVLETINDTPLETHIIEEIDEGNLMEPNVVEPVIEMHMNIQSDADFIAASQNKSKESIKDVEYISNPNVEIVTKNVNKEDDDLVKFNIDEAKYIGKRPQFVVDIDFSDLLKIFFVGLAMIYSINIGMENLAMTLAGGMVGYMTGKTNHN